MTPRTPFLVGPQSTPPPLQLLQISAYVNDLGSRIIITKLQHKAPQRISAHCENGRKISFTLHTRSILVLVCTDMLTLRNVL